MRDVAEAGALVRERENVEHDGLDRVDPAVDVVPLPIRTEDLHVVVPELPAAGDVAGLRLLDHFVPGPLAGLVALDLVREATDRQQDLVGRGRYGELTPIGE